jgi:uncharacterized protein YfaP (DUF2135 family)
MSSFRRRRSRLWILIPILLTGEAAAKAPVKANAKSSKPLRVTITTPQGGIIDEDYTVDLSARVSDPRARTALLSVNGAVYEVPVRGGRIEQTIVAVPGNNRVGVIVRRRGEIARDSITFYLRGKRTDLVVLLTWAARGEIIDLWVREPGGETCKWDHRQTRSEGRLLDFSKDAIGFGSQAYVLPSITAGRYRIKVHYWGAYGRNDDRQIWSYREMIDRLDRLDERLQTHRHKKIDKARAVILRALRSERLELLRRLDKWASPAAPQTPVRAEAILFPGTRHERRWRFSLVSQRTGQLLSLGEVEVTEAMIRSARADRRRGGTP